MSRYTSDLEDKERKKLNNMKNANKIFSSESAKAIKQAKELKNDSTVPISQSYTIDEKLFKGITDYLLSYLKKIT